MSYNIEDVPKKYLKSLKGWGFDLSSHGANSLKGHPSTKGKSDKGQIKSTSKV